MHSFGLFLGQDDPGGPLCQWQCYRVLSHHTSGYRDEFRDLGSTDSISVESATADCEEGCYNFDLVVGKLVSNHNSSARRARAALTLSSAAVGSIVRIPFLHELNRDVSCTSPYSPAP